MNNNHATIAQHSQGFQRNSCNIENQYAWKLLLHSPILKFFFSDLYCMNGVTIHMVPGKAFQWWTIKGAQSIPLLWLLATPRPLNPWVKLVVETVYFLWSGRFSKFCRARQYVGIYRTGVISLKYRDAIFKNHNETNWGAYWSFGKRDQSTLFSVKKLKFPNFGEGEDWREKILANKC